MNLLITGGAGFIGSNFIKYSIQNNPESKIINLDKLTYAGNLENLIELKNNKNYMFVQGNICNKQLVGKLVADADAVINFAAETHVDRSIKNSREFIRTNIEGTRVLLEAARNCNIKKFLQVSTDEVYGSISDGSFKETDALQPNSPYAASKAAADMLARSYFVTYKLPVVITRSCNNFGPYQYPEKIIPLFITNLLEDKKVPLYGDGLNVREWIYVKDNCKAINFLLENGKAGEIYNVGSGKEKTNGELTQILLRKLGKDEGFIEHVRDRLGHDRRYSLDCSKINNLGWHPKHEFEKSLEETIKWYKENEKWWGKLKH
jgi:dTDP-glucose 4,6-dehydratase